MRIKYAFTLLISFSLLLFLFALSLRTGLLHLHTSLFILIGKNQGIDATTVWQVRLPRALGAILCGSALGAAGVIAQGVFRNPLAEPTLIGLSSASTLGTIVMIAAGAATYGTVLNISVSILVAIACALLIFFLAPERGFGFLITGIAISAVLTAVAGIAISVSNKPSIQSLSFWNFGSLTLLTNHTVATMAPFIVVGLLVAIYVSRKLDLYSFGDITLRSLGISGRWIRFWAIIAMAFLIGASVSAVGSIAFLGLLTPHILRLMMGPSHKHLLILSIFTGANILLLADLLARTIFQPHEIPLGLITSLLGAPVLIYLIRSRSAAWVSHD
jgi:iron complex transport system permease protein